MDISLSGKHAMVCGASAGIGRATAGLLAELGASVCLVARSADKLQEVLAELPAGPGVQHDWIAQDFDQPEALADAVATKAAEHPAQILINNTGGPPAGRAIDADPDAYLRGFRQHLLCGQLLVQALLPGMHDAGYGRIINIISTSVKIPIPGLGVSNTIRGAVASWAKTLANELGPDGITVNNVLPGFTWTGRLQSLIQSKADEAGVDFDTMAARMRGSVPLQRFADPRETAQAIAFLAAPAAGYISGINLPVDGGRTGCL